MGPQTNYFTRDHKPLLGLFLTQWSATAVKFEMHRIGTVCDAEGGRYSNCGSMLYPHYFLSTASDGWAKTMVSIGYALYYTVH